MGRRGQARPVVAAAPLLLLMVPVEFIYVGYGHAFFSALTCQFRRSDSPLVVRTTRTHLRPKPVRYFHSFPSSPSQMGRQQPGA